MATKEAPPAKDAAKDAAAPSGDAAAKPAGKPLAALLPVIAVVILAPALSFAVGQFVLIPQLKKQIAAMPADAAPAEGHEAPAEAEHAAPAKEGGHGGGHGKKGESAAGPANAYEMENIVVNLAGTMGTRYLKTTFLVTGGDKALRATFEGNKPKLIDVTLNVLSSLSLADLEEAGAKNIIREKLILAYNQALGRKVAEQIYFTDFVVQ
jgi:flagellar FliL protein